MSTLCLRTIHLIAMLGCTEALSILTTHWNFSTQPHPRCHVCLLRSFSRGIASFEIWPILKAMLYMSRGVMIKGQLRMREMNSTFLFGAASLRKILGSILHKGQPYQLTEFFSTMERQSRMARLSPLAMERKETVDSLATLKQT